MTDHKQPSLLNIPNLLAAVRLLGAPWLILLAVMEQPWPFFGLLILLLATDWFDGKLAVMWNQQTEFGAWLDSAADATLYAAMLFGAIWLKGEELRSEWMWLAAVPISYGLSVAASMLKFGRLPSYHTRVAKTSWWLTTIAAICWFGGWSLWPLRIAATAVALTNLEAIAITCILSERRSNVLSVYHVWKASRKSPADAER